MKVAVCLSGQPREVAACADSLKENLLSGVEADFFAHLWSSSSHGRDFRSFRDFRAHNPRHPGILSWFKLRRQYKRYKRRSSRHEAKITFPTDAAIVKAQARSAYDPVRLCVEAQIDFDISRFTRAERKEDSLAHAAARPGNVLSMFYSIREANRLKTSFEKEHGFEYDCVVRCRTDLRFNSPFRISDYADELRKAVLIPDRKDYGQNDMLALSSSSNMDVYSSAFEFIEPHYASGGLFNPETILYSHLEAQNIPCFQKPIDYELVRSEA